MQKHRWKSSLRGRQCRVEAGNVYVMLAFATTEQLREGCDFILTGPNGERVEDSHRPTTR